MTERPTSRTRAVLRIAAGTAIGGFVIAVVMGVWWWWPRAYERALPPGASSAARTTAALCDREAPGWCAGLGMMYLCGIHGLPIDRARAAELDARDCALDPDYCIADRAALAWDELDADEIGWVCQGTENDTTYSIADLPIWLRRPGP